MFPQKCQKPYNENYKPLEESFHIAAFPIKMTINVSPIEKKIELF